MAAFRDLRAVCVFARRPATPASTFRPSRSLHADPAVEPRSRPRHQRRLTMKTIITLLTAATLAAGATNAMALDRQANDDALSYANSVQASRGFGGAYASARVAGGEIRNSTVNTQSQEDFQLVGTR